MNLSKREQIIFEIGVLQGQKEMAYDLAVSKNGQLLVGTQEVRYSEFTEDIDERKELLIQKVDTQQNKGSRDENT